MTKYQVPCDLCTFSPPSSFDGKPCSMCPALGKRTKSVTNWREEIANGQYHNAITTLVRSIGTLTYGKMRWFEQSNGQWYDRDRGDYISLEEMTGRVIDAVREAEDY